MICNCFKETDEKLASQGTRLKSFHALMISEPSGKLTSRTYWPVEKLNGKAAKGGVLLQFCPFCGKSVDDLAGVPVEARPDTPETRAEDEAADRELAEELAADDPVCNPA